MSVIHHFGEFRLDSAARELLHGGKELLLPLKVFECIAYLVEHRDRAVGRDELISAVWGKVDLTDSTLSQMIRQARQALGDSGDDQRVIKTVRGFGYRWVAPVTEEIRGRAEPRRWRSAVILTGSALLAGAMFLWLGGQGSLVDQPATYHAEGEIVLLLPVAVEADPEYAWVRLGLMDAIAERLRAAGQAMVPSDTVIALLRGRSGEPGAHELDRLINATGVRLILEAQAQVSGTRWTVSLRDAGGGSGIAGVGEAHDVLEAGRDAADRVALLLGLAPADELDVDAGLNLLLQQVEAARLAEEIDTARSLIESADAGLRRHPEIRFQRARIEYYSGDLDAAESGFASLLEMPVLEKDPVLRARSLNGLAAVLAVRGQRDDAVPLLEEAARLLESRDSLEVLGYIHMNLGNLAQERGDFEHARDRLAQARRIFQGMGDLRGLGVLEANVAVLETRRGRYAEARRAFESAARRSAAMQDVAGELSARTYMAQIDLLMLEVSSGLSLIPRLDELLTRAGHPETVTRALLAKARLLDTAGGRAAARALLEDALETEDGSPDSIPRLRLNVYADLGEMALQEGDADGAAEAAGLVVGWLEVEEDELAGDIRASAWLTLVRAHLDRRDTASAALASRAFSTWAELDQGLSSKLRAALATAEVVAAEGDGAAAAAGFERALALADRSRVPLYLLEVAESYVSWLLGGGGDLARALSVADRLADHADRHYGAALLQLRVYHALGPVSAWRGALSRAQSLAGERRLPAELLTAP